MGKVETLNTPNLYIFDLHGTLVKGNEDAMCAIFEKLFKEWDIHVTAEKRQIEELMGRFQLEDIIACLIPQAASNDITKMAARYRELSPQITPKHLRLFEEVKETLVQLRSRGDKIAVITSTNQKMARKMVKWVSLENLVDEVIGMRAKEDAVDFKTRSIKRLRQKYDCQKVYMIGDKHEDMKAGQEAGAITVFFNPGEARQEYASYTISNLRALVDL